MNRYTMCSAVNGAAHGLVLQTHTVTAIEHTGFTSISTRHYMKNDDPFLTDIRPTINTKQHFHTPDTSTPVDTRLLLTAQFTTIHRH